MHLLKVARALMFTKNVPNIYFIDVVLSTTYLINHMSSKAIDMKIPIDVLKCRFPSDNEKVLHIPCLVQVLYLNLT